MKSYDMQQETQTTVSEIAARTPGSLKVFEKYHIDYCCKGRLSLEEACRRAGVPEPTVRHEIEVAGAGLQAASIRADAWSLDLLVSYIVQNHHAYVRKIMPEILFLLEKVAGKHGRIHPELHEVHEHFKQLAEELKMHMGKEEMVLFPAIEQVVNESKRDSTSQSRLGFSLGYPVEVMEAEHEAAGRHLAAMGELTHHYTVPEGGCHSYRLLYSRLREFEEDLHMHIHLENNILFPRAMELESSVVSNPILPV